MGSPEDEQVLAGDASAERAVEGLVESCPDPVPPPVDLTAAAFFDVDNTLVQGSSLVHFGRGLAARKYFRYSEVWKFLYAQAKFQLTGKENSDDVAEGRRKALSFIEGRTTTELSEPVAMVRKFNEARSFKAGSCPGPMRVRDLLSVMFP